MSKALDDVMKNVPETHVKETQDVTQIGSKYKEKCPNCGGTVIYRCQEDHCRLGMFYGYRVYKGGSKIYEQDCLAPENIFLGKQVKGLQSAGRKFFVFF